MRESSQQQSVLYSNFFSLKLKNCKQSSNISKEKLNLKQTEKLPTFSRFSGINLGLNMKSVNGEWELLRCIGKQGKKMSAIML